MRLKKNKIFDAVFISDIHYLIDRKIKSHAHKDLFKALKILEAKGIRVRKIFLVGDIIENWYFSASVKLKKRKKRLSDFFEKIERILTSGGERFFIIGNHDTVNFDQSLPPIIDEYLKENGWNIMDRYEDDSRIVIHGHQGQYGKLVWFTSIFMVRILYRLSVINPRIWHFLEGAYKKRLNYDWHKTMEESIRYYERLSQKVNQGNRIMITGHTHQFLFLEDYRIINTGDWVESRTLVFQKGKKYGGFSFDKKRKPAFRQEFTFKDKTWKSDVRISGF